MNGRVAERERLVLRDGYRFSVPELAGPSRAPRWDEVPETFARRFGSSLSLGRFVPGVMVVLV